MKLLKVFRYKKFQFRDLTHYTLLNLDASKVILSYKIFIVFIFFVRLTLLNRLLKV